jgi:death-on-curing protein
VTIWISRELALGIHDEQIAEHGGSSGVRDHGLLESALARPLNLAGYGEPTVAELGATYAVAIARNHPFVDGNKRTAFASMTTFLDLNGVAFGPTDAEAVIMMMALAAGELEDSEFLAWVGRHAGADD